jgi:hypothetical protein
MEDYNQDTGLAWVYTLVFAFTLVIVHFVVYPVLNSYLVPALVSSTTDTSGVTEAKIRGVITILRITSYLFFFGGFVYSLLAIFKRERRDYYV